MEGHTSETFLGHLPGAHLPLARTWSRGHTYLQGWEKAESVEGILTENQAPPLDRRHAFASATLGQL